MEENKTAVTGTATATTETNTEAGKATETKKPEFTPEQEAYMQKMLNKEYAKFATKFEKKESEIKEVTKKEGLSEIDQVKADLEAERQLRRRAEADNLLTIKGLKSSDADENSFLLQFVTGKDAEDTSKRIDVLSKLVSTLAQKNVDGKLAEVAGGFKGNNKTDVVDDSKLTDEQYYKKYYQKK